MPTEELTLPCRGLAVAAQRWTCGTPRRRLLALHGWLDNSNSFARLLPLLHDVEVVAPDLPGHGLSQHHAPDAQYHFIDWVGDVLALTAALGWQHFGLLGHSMGAGIAALTAGAHPESIDELILLDGLGPFSAEAEQVPERMARHHQQLSRLQARQAPVHADRQALASVLCRVVQNLSRDSALLLLERGAEEVGEGGGVRSRNDPRLRATSLFLLTEAQVQSFLRRIRCPTLLVRPRAGYAFAPEQLAARLPLIADLQVCHLEGGHHAHLEQAPAVAQALRAFWD